MKLGKNEKQILAYLHGKGKMIPIRELLEKFSPPAPSPHGKGIYLQKSICLSVIDRMDIKGFLIFKDRNRPACLVGLSLKGKQTDPQNQ